MVPASAPDALGAVADRVCVYALVEGLEGPLRLRGIAGERLRVAAVGGIATVIGIVPRAPKAGMAAMRRYDEVQRELMAIWQSVLPARFGTCASSVDELAVSVRDRRAAIRQNLRLVRGRAQMTIRLFTRLGVRSEPNRSRVRTRSEYGDGATQGTRYLRQRMEEAQVPGASRLRPAVARWVRAERSEPRPHGRFAGTVYHLVPRSNVSAYRRAVARVAVEAGLTVVVSGPWPPYAFADVV
jgi:hypothetical protein